MSNNNTLTLFSFFIFFLALVEVLREGAGQKPVLEGSGFSRLNISLTTAFQLFKYLHNQVLCRLHTQILQLSFFAWFLNTICSGLALNIYPSYIQKIPLKPDWHCKPEKGNTEVIACQILYGHQNHTCAADPGAASQPVTASCVFWKGG